MSRPVLYVFAFSHYCEKARWALERLGVAYRLHYTMPGMNRRIAKQLGASAGSLPFLSAGAQVVAGSAAIIDWGERHRSADSANLAGSEPDEIAAIERRLDDVTGVHVRRCYYSEALLTDPASVRPIFSRDLPLLQKIGVTLGWSRIVPMMIKGMDLGHEQGRASRDTVAKELDWLDGLIADGRPYLTGEAFNRADLTAASLLAPLVNPAQHPTYAGLSLPAELADAVKDWQSRPILRWVTQVYAQHR